MACEAQPECVRSLRLLEYLHTMAHLSLRPDDCTLLVLLSFVHLQSIEFVMASAACAPPQLRSQYP